MEALPGREAGRTGAPPAARAFGDALLVLVPRNVGDELHRLTGTHPPRSRLMPPGVDLKAADADADHVFLPAGDELVAFSVGTWREEWRATLPDLPSGVKWVVRAGRTSVIVCPTEALPEEPWDSGRTARNTLTHPTALRLIGSAAGVFDAATRCTFPVLLFESDTGKLAQRFDLPALGPPAAVIPRSDGLLVVTTGRAVWLGKN